MMKAPDFWFRDRPSWLSVMLRPFSWLYAFGHFLHVQFVKPYRSSLPVICIGNLVVGGSGKTPTALAVMEHIQNTQLFDKPVFLTRGYGGSFEGPILIDPKVHDASMAGDEALLLARKAPVIVSRDRKAGAKLAEQNGFDVILMDDGLQNPSLYKDLRLIVIDGGTGFGNGLTLPAGPLREEIESGLANSDAVLVIGEDKKNVQALVPQETSILNASIESETGPLKDTPYLAFCGLGRPEKFFATLRNLGVNLVDCVSYPDHHAYNQDDLDQLHERAGAVQARLITTEKDAVKLAQFKGYEDVAVLPIHLRWHDENELSVLLKRLKT